MGKVRFYSIYAGNKYYDSVDELKSSITACWNSFAGNGA